MMGKGLIKKSYHKRAYNVVMPVIRLLNKSSVKSNFTQLKKIRTIKIKGKDKVWVRSLSMHRDKSET